MTQKNYKYKVGDKILRLNGTKPLVITSLNNTAGYLYARYAEKNKSGSQFFYFREVKPYDEPETTTMNTQLYSFTDGGTEKFGTLLAKNAAGLYVIEVRGTNEVIVKRPDELTEVVPFTAKVRLNNSNTVQFEFKEGQVQPGDVIITKSGEIGVVKELNTKAKAARPSTGVRRVLTEPLS